MIMKSQIGLKLVGFYLLIVVIIVVWIFTKSGDTPIFPAIAVLLPWGVIFTVLLQDWNLPSFVPLILNISINTSILYVVGFVLERFIKFLMRFR